MKTMRPDIFKWQVSTALKISFLFVIFVLSFVYKAEAAITNPYTVDEKPQVHFGDTVEIIDGDKTYFGLENYLHDYVNGYLHMSYTYTHHFCCYDTHTPQVYITNVDPRSTTTPVIKSLLYVYPFSPGEATDWYLIDIQFEETGYVVTVKRKGVSEIYNTHVTVENLISSNWIALANNHPLSPDNTPVADSMSFAPLMYKTDIVPPPARTPVIIVPGIMASELINSETEELIWPNLTKVALSINDDFLNELAMDSEGKSINPNISSNNILKKISNSDYFESLIINLSQDDYQENINLFTFSYDWRKDINLISEDLKERIKEIKTQTGSKKVNIIAHSMGGLIVKKYLYASPESDINILIDIATPHLGAPKSIQTLLFGDNLGINYLFGVFNLNQERIKIISQNMPSIYELLPSKNYNSLGNYLYDLDDIDGNGIRGSLDYEQTKVFLKRTGRNSALIDRADDLHRKIDDLNPANYGVDAYNIVGCGTETLGKIFMLNKEMSGNIEYNISYTNGDGTVPLASAKSLPSEHLFYYKNATHALMPSAPGIRELIVSILNNETLIPDNFTQISTEESDCPKISGHIVSFHSPIELHIYDSQNRHSGPTEIGDIENNIPGVSYEVLGGNKFAFIPDDEEYKVIGNATAEGSFNARIEKVNDEVVVETKYFNEVPIFNSTSVTFIVNSNTSNLISIDKEGDGIFESQVESSSQLDQSQSGDLIRPITTLSLKGNQTKDGSYISSVQISLIATDDNSGVLKTEYSLDNGLTWIKFVEPFTVNIRGGAIIKYKSTDKAGNIESIKISNVNIIYPASSGKKN